MKKINFSLTLEKEKRQTLGKIKLETVYKNSLEI